MKITMFMAMSVNGTIVDSKGSEDFLSNAGWKELCRLTKKTGCLIWGRKTYEMVKRWDKKYLNVIKARIIVVSRKKHDDKNCIYVKDPKSAVSMAKRLGFKSAILSGGPTLNNSFIKKGLVDDMLLNVEPIAINGKNLFNDEHIMNKLIFVGVKRINNKVLQLHYKVK